MVLSTTEARKGCRGCPAVEKAHESLFRKQQMTAAHERLVLFLPRGFRRTRKASINSKIISPFGSVKRWESKKEKIVCVPFGPTPGSQKCHGFLIDGCPRGRGVLKPNESVICLPLKHGLFACDRTATGHPGRMRCRSSIVIAVMPLVAQVTCSQGDPQAEKKKKGL